MTVQFKILSTDAETGHAQVNYFDEATSPAGITINVPLPIENGAFPAPAKMSEIIGSYVPIRFFELETARAAGGDLNLTALDSLIGVTQGVTMPAQPVIEGPTVMTVPKAVF
jgi:hypothetical protein